MIKNWKTSLIGVATFAIAVLHVFVPEIPGPDIATAVSALLLGLAAKDGNVTGGTVQQ